MTAGEPVNGVSFDPFSRKIFYYQFKDDNEEIILRYIRVMGGRDTGCSLNIVLFLKILDFSELCKFC